MNPYEELGIARDAAQMEVREAFRTLAQRHHPDKGGDTDRFARINAAYRTLRDPKKRKNYDEYGVMASPTDDDRENYLRGQALAFVFQVVSSREDVTNIDVIAVARNMIDEQRNKLTEVKNKAMPAAIKRLEEARDRLTRKKKGEDDFFTVAFNYEIEKIKKQQGEIDVKLQNLQAVREYLGEYGYTFEQARSGWMTFTTGTGGY